MVRFCSNCNRAIDDTDKFCRECGKDTENSIDYNTYYKHYERITKIDSKAINVIREIGPKNVELLVDGKEEAGDASNTGGVGDEVSDKLRHLLVHDKKDLKKGNISYLIDKKVEKDETEIYKKDEKNKKDKKVYSPEVEKMIKTMVMKKVTPDLLEDMVRARKAGATYAKIQNKFNVSQWVTITYLKGIKKEKYIADIAEELKVNIIKRAIEILSNDRFIDIINLNELCTSSHFDFLANKDGEKWLIDITVGDEKELKSKAISLRMIPRFICAILYMSKDLKEYNLIELKGIVPGR